MNNSIPIETCPVDISDEDILKAMKTISGYLDITPGDFKEIYKIAYGQAVERIVHSVTASDVMTKNVITTGIETSLIDVADLLADNGISGIPIVDDDSAVLGIISEKDFIFHFGADRTNSFMKVVSQCLKNKECIAVSIRKQAAKDIMSAPVITANEKTNAFELAKIFTDKNINRIPIIDKTEKLTGMVTRGDLVQSYCMYS